MLGYIRPVNLPDLKGGIYQLPHPIVETKRKYDPYSIQPDQPKLY
jgi:hypothetical protein